MYEGGLGAVGLRTVNIDRSVRFYTEALPGSVTRRRDEPDRRAWIRVLGVPFEIAQIEPWPALSESQRRALPATSFLVRPEELDSLLARLKAAEVPTYGPVLKMTGVSVGLYFCDPDGNPLSLSCPEGYPSEGLSRNPRLWVAEPYEW